MVNTLSPSRALLPKQEQLGGPNFHDDDSTTTSQLPPAPTDSVKRQRGMYSELLSQTTGPVLSPSKVVAEPLVQPAPPARVFERPHDLTLKLDNSAKAHFDLKSMEPKVQVPFISRPGVVPRKIEIERKKRIFSGVQLEDLLLERSIDHKVPSATSLEFYAGDVPLLPLESFDDTDFECRSVAAWLELGTKSDGTCALPARALDMSEDGTGTWRSCSVTGVEQLMSSEDPEDVLWRVDFTDGAKEGPASASLHRLHVYFIAEDPFVFADRVASAHALRHTIEKNIVKNIYADFMPMEDMRHLDTEQLSRITLNASNTRALKGKGVSAQSIVQEINMDYTRTMNWIVLEHKAGGKAGEAGGAGDMIKMLSAVVEEKPPAVPAPESGLFDIPNYSFSTAKNSFCFNSFLNKPEIIKAVVLVRKESAKVLGTRLFALPTKSTRLDEFSSSQSSAISGFSSFVKETWSSSVISHVKQQLKDVSKGWFNLEESNTEVYKFSKLRKFLGFLNFIMQDTLRFAVEDSLLNYKTFVEGACAPPVTVVSTNKVTVDFSLGGTLGEDAARLRSRKPPLFLLDLAIDSTGEKPVFAYSSSSDSFTSSVLQFFDKSLFSIQKLIRIERKVMKNLFWSRDPVMNTVHPSEEWVSVYRNDIETAMSAAASKLDEYLKLYDPLLEFLQTDVQTYLESIEVQYGGKMPDDLEDPDDWNPEDAEIDVKSIKELSSKHMDLMRKLEEDIPVSVNLGAFSLSCSKVRTELSNKHEAIAGALMEMACKVTIQYTDVTSEKFEDMMVNLKKSPSDIEAVDDIKAFISTVPALVQALGPRIDTNLGFFNILEEAKYKIDGQDFNRKWEVFSWPKKIFDKVEDLEVVLQGKTNNLLEDMKEDQAAFMEKLNGIQAEVGNLHTFTNIDRVDQVTQHVKKIKAELQRSGEEARLFNNREALFGVDVRDYVELSEISKSFEPYYDLWLTVDGWIKSLKNYQTSPFLELDAEKIEKHVSTSGRTLAKNVKFFEKNNLTGCLAIASQIKESVDTFKPSVPVIMSLRNPGMRERHWDNLNKACKTEIVPSETLTLDQIMETGIAEQLPTITKIAETAGKEFNIEQALDKMEEAWQTVNLVIDDYRDTGTCILKGADEYMALLDEQITMTQAMTFSAFKGPFEERIDKWNTILQVVSEVVDEWLAVQRNWLYLQPIFDSADINKQLPIEGKRFNTVDKHWRGVMAQARGGGGNGELCIKFCDNAKLLERFRESCKLLDMVQKGLADYLETKRAGFSRFYFLSNDELLEILSESKDPLRVQPHLKKCFEGIKSVDFAEDLTITKMKSSEGEIVPWVTVVDPKNKGIENWMVEVTEAMLEAVRMQFLLSIENYTEVKRTDWMQNWPGQIVLNGSQVHWTREVEEALNERGNAGIADYYEQLVQQLNDMVYLIRGNLSKMARVTIGALAVVDVHARDVMKKMAANGVSNIRDFDWQSQMRFYWRGDRDNGNVRVTMVSSDRAYGYEYLGNSFRLVITPLTDKCYLTLMGALQMILGGAPAGPAGTGKTETTKDLAKALAKQCVVFNCSDGLDFLAMGKFFKGLASSGAWACFDEFNRINIEVLSVIAQQIMTLQQAVQGNVPRIIFEDTDIKVDPEFSVYITMNPGYAGRSDLPDNLEALFRPVAMMVPDYALIGEIMLFSFGYLENRKCAQKMVATFRLCSEQLSSQDHYDYGMRAVKTVITAAGNLKMKSPDEKEEALLRRALEDVNVPKFLAHDLPLFWGILSDLFPGIERPAFDYGPLLTAIKRGCEKKNLRAVPIFLRKNIELYEMICVRHGLMVVGPTGGGKSACINTLQLALSELKTCEVEGEKYESTEIYHLNPKAITMGQLYGESDANTHEWRDGIVPNIVRECSKRDDRVNKWVLFDGPVDAIWIESMNTVLDDNKKLCLISGEIISLSEEMTMMFEPEDLKVASPATVSRCGMIYMEPKSLGFNPLLESWYNKLPNCMDARFKERLTVLSDRYLKSGINSMRRNCEEPLPSTDNNLVQSLMNILDCYFNPFIEKEGEDPPSKESVDQLFDCLEGIFMFAYTWSVCCTVNKKGRSFMDSFVRLEAEAQGTKFGFPESGTIFDYLFDSKGDFTEDQKPGWVSWMKTAPEYVFDNKASYSELIIPTQDSIRYTHLLDQLVRNNKHCLMTGPTGTGKSVNINKHISTGLPDTYVPLTLMFSAQTSQNATQDMIDSKCEKRRKGVFGPSAGKQFVIFVDDVNMPQKEEYGAQPPIEILRQWFDNSGWYDRKSLTFRKIIDCIYVNACGPPGGGRNDITARYIRHFNIIGYTAMQDESMALIFGTILNNFLSNSFEPELKPFADPLVSATINVYNIILEDLRPTPAKPHYTFNLRDLSKVFQGMLMMNSRKVSTTEDLCRMWVHESRRVFADRLISKEDTKWFDGLLEEQVKTNLEGMEWQTMVEGRPIMCSDFMIPGADPKIYEEIKDLSQVQPTIEEYLGEYNAESKQPMNLVMFMDAIGHVSKISRVIRQPQGNALLLGVGGSGRQSMSRMATYISEYHLGTIEISKGYGLTEWRENIKELLLMAGVDGKPVVFLFNDVQVVFNQMLEDVNSILNSGDVPNLYAPEDMEKISDVCKPECVKKRLPPTKMNIFNEYLKRVKANIHMVLCMSPLGDAFRERLRMFPSIVNCCTIDWFAEWPDEALQSVATRSLTEAGVNLGDSTANAVTFVKDLHMGVFEKSKEFLETLRRYNYVTPTSFLEVLSTYKSVLKTKRDEVGTLKSRLQTGLDKLISTATQVGTLQEQLREMEPVLVKTQGEVGEMIVHIGIEKEAAAITQATVEEEEAVAQDKAAETKAIADDAQRDLDEALPALDEAVKCLKELKKADLDEVKNLGKPPSGVKLTMEAVCIMFGVKPEKINDPDNPGKKVNDYFGVSKKTVLSNSNKLLEDLKAYDRDNIPQSVIEKIKPYIEMEEFKPEVIKKASKACTAMCMWARAMYTYHQVVLVVEPKKKLLAEAQASLEITMAKLKKAQDSLQEVKDKIAGLEADLKLNNDKKQKLANDVEECGARLIRAEKLIGGLGGERSRWTESCATLETAYNNLVGDCLVSAGAIAYSGPFTPDFRKELNSTWVEALVTLNLPHSEGCDIQKTLAKPVEIRSWQLAGLPSDNHSIQNGIIQSKARRYPLFIDPQGQANKFIKNMGNDLTMSENGIDVIKLTDKNFLRTLENGVRFGRWVLLENIGEALDASLEPLLLQQKFKQGGTEMIKVGDSTIPWNDSFKFFMTTKMPNPHYPPEVCVKVSLLNFAITFSGLEDQLLGVVVVEEMPEMEEKKNALMIANARMKKELQDIEDLILFKLSNATGNILDDHELIDTLANSKKTAQEITTKVAEAETTEKEIDRSREGYRSVAYRGSLLYFCINELNIIDPMYQYSLQWFTGLFVQSIRSAEASDKLDERLEILNNHFTYYVYQNICRSLFEAHKLLFSFLLTIKIMQGNDLVDPMEWRFLISGKVASSVDIENPDPNWLDGRMWGELKQLSTLPAFEGLAADVAAGSDAWKEIFDSLEPEKMPLIGKWENKLNSLQKMCVLRTIRIDKLPESILTFVVSKQGQKYVEPPPFNLPACFADSSVVTPLIFVLTKGSDPTKEFYQFAHEMRFDKKVKGLSLGQGQGPKAIKMIEEATQKGTWVYLQNCHLYISWLNTLETITEEITAEKTHKDFRLWLTSMPCPQFPVSILQNGVKMTNEPPKGMKANLTNTYFKLNNDLLNVTDKPDLYKKLLFALSFFHACAQERRKFGPLGWNIPYEFNNTDLDISKEQLALFLNEYDEVPFDVLTMLTSYINYGGRVTDYIDLRTIDVIMKSFYNPGVLEDGYKFDPEGVYYSIGFDQSNPHQSYVEYIDSLPLSTGPGVHGMHENANISCANREAFSMFDTILSLQARDTSKGGLSREEIICHQAEHIENDLNKRGMFDTEAVGMQYPVVYEQSMNTVLIQECIRYNNLIAEMERTLPTLQKALKGLVVMSGELDAMGNSIAVNQVPGTWASKAYPSMKPLAAWSDDLMARLDMVHDWIEHDVPKVFWISGFYFPQSFLTGSRQNFARKKQYAIDTVDFDFVVKKEAWQDVKEGPEDGVYIRGLFLEGARWNDDLNTIDDSRPKQLYTEMAMIHLLPVKDRQMPEKEVYRCPCYKILSRRGVLATTGHSTNFIMWIELPAKGATFMNFENNVDNEKWIKAGVGLFTSLTY
jgi:dynein heavy chain